MNQQQLSADHADVVSITSDSAPTSEEYEIISTDQTSNTMDSTNGGANENSDTATKRHSGAKPPSTLNLNQHHPLSTPDDDDDGDVDESPSFCDVPASGGGGGGAADATAAAVDAAKLRLSTEAKYLRDGSVFYERVLYLGSTAVESPRSEQELQRNMAILNGQYLIESGQKAMLIGLKVPPRADGKVILYDQVTSDEIASFPINRIVFCARGEAGTPEERCVAFTFSQPAASSAHQVASFQCHVFHLHSVDLVRNVLEAFIVAFKSITPSKTAQPIDDRIQQRVYRFDVTVDMKEEDSKGNFTSCPRDKDAFKVRANLVKDVCFTVQQSSTNHHYFTIERCFGMLLAPGRHLKHGDMQCICLVSMHKLQERGDSVAYHITGRWDPTEPAFELLNTETTRDTRVYLTIAVDLVIQGIEQPVRFLVEAAAKIYPTTERFWYQSYFRGKTLHEEFALHLRDVDPDLCTVTHQWDVVSVSSATQLQRRLKQALHADTLGHTTLMVPPVSDGNTPTSNLTTPNQDQQPDSLASEPLESDNDEPLLSGTGDVNKECSQVTLEHWSVVLQKWRQNLKQRPTGKPSLTELVRAGIPEALRGEVWQLLAGCEDDEQTIFEKYRILITKDSPCENIILRDINRTFPAHEFFRENGGPGQEALYKICKAYSVHDVQVGYCQGLSFLAAALLLHMPEEQAFCVLDKMMHRMGLRNVYLNSFEDLHLKLYQLGRLIEDNIPQLHAHFTDLGIETHMYASQWFLTLFTAKFPLYVVFHVLDLFLLEHSKCELLALDFEGVLKHFRVTVPKKYRNEDKAHHMLKTAVGLNLKRLKKYEKEYQVRKAQEIQTENPIERLERENKRVHEANLRLEQENEDLAQELVTSKITLRKQLDAAEDKVESLSKDLSTAQESLHDLEEEKRRLETEVAQLKEMCRRELQNAEAENSRNTTIISEYKQICSQLSKQLEKEKSRNKERIEAFKERMKSCDECRLRIDECINATGSANRKQSSGSTVDGANVDPNADPNEPPHERAIRQLELELAQTKLALVESQCKNQDLTHELTSVTTELQASKNSWINKTLSSIRAAPTSLLAAPNKSTPAPNNVQT